METARTRISGYRVRGVRLAGAAILALVTSEFSASANAQPYCRVEYTTWNADRQVSGPVGAECQAGFHDPALGRWGVKTESAPKMDGDPFEGWCRNDIVQDPEDDRPSRTVCTDGGYEWNSCASHSRSPPTRALYNHNNYQQQKSTTGRSIGHGGGVVRITARMDDDSSRAAEDGNRDARHCGRRELLHCDIARRNPGREGRRKRVRRCRGNGVADLSADRVELPAGRTASRGRNRSERYRRSSGRCSCEDSVH